MTYAPQPDATIEIKTSFLFFNFIYVFFKPRVSINGGPEMPVRWGITPVPVPAGRYQVEAWIRYGFMRFMGRNGAVVDVPPGSVVRVQWRAPWMILLKGPVKVSASRMVGAPGAPGPAAGPQGFAGLPAPPPPAPVAAAAPLAPAPATPSGWFPDPAGRHELRYFDGSTWTDHVTSGGVQSTDPVSPR